MLSSEYQNGFGNTRLIPKNTPTASATDKQLQETGQKAECYGGWDRQAPEFIPKTWEDNKGDVVNVYEYLYSKGAVDKFNSRLFDCLAESLQVNQVIKTGYIDQAKQYHHDEENYQAALDVRTADYKLDNGLLIRGASDENYRSATLLENPINIKCDYLRIRFKLPSEDKMYELLDYSLGKDNWSILKDVGYSLGRGVPTMANKIQGKFNVIGGYDINCIDETTQELEYNILIDFKGEFLRTKTIVDQWIMMRGLKFAFKGKATRFDIAIDDYSYQLIPLKEMIKGYNDGDNWFFRTYGIQFVKKSKKAPVVPTHYFGSRESQSMVRVYNHDLDCMRFELECKRDKADYLFNFFTSLERCKGLWDDWKKVIEFDEKYEGYKGSNLAKIYKEEVGENKFNDWDVINNTMNIEVDRLGEDYLSNNEWDSELQKILGSYAVGAIDFRNKDDVSNIDKASRRDCTRCSWWQEFIDLIGIDFKPSIPKPKKNLLKVVKWIHRQVMPSLAMIQEGLGDAEFLEWLFKYLNLSLDNRLSEWQYNQIKFISDYPKLVTEC